jgi:Fucose permease
MKTIVHAQAGRFWAFAVAGGLLAIWGLALWLYNGLFFKFAHFFALDPVRTAFTLSTYHAAYILLALPAVLFHRRFGLKLGILAGLSVFGISAFLLYFALISHQAWFFLAAALAIGSCGAWLDTALNPLAAACGPRETAIRRLNLAHAANGLGLFAAYYTAVSLLGPDYLLSSDMTAKSAAQPYVLVGLGAILLAFLVEQIALPDFATKGAAKSQSSSFKAEIAALSRDKHLRFAAAALAAYCAVLTILWTANYKYHHTEVPALSVTTLQRGWCWFVIGRLAAAILMRRIAPELIFKIAAACALCTITIAVAAGGSIGWAGLLASSFFLSLTYPTIFAGALRQNWASAATAAGLLVMAAGAGNILSSLATSLALDAALIHPRLVMAAAVPLQAVVAVYAFRSARHATP